jgi:hypothetical protein
MKREGGDAKAGLNTDFKALVTQKNLTEEFGSIL